MFVLCRCVLHGVDEDISSKNWGGFWRRVLKVCERSELGVSVRGGGSWKEWVRGEERKKNRNEKED